mgnify:CR=1 FL=1
MGPRTRQEQKTLQSKGDIRGWFPLPRGRPPKSSSFDAPDRGKENCAPPPPIEEVAVIISPHAAANKKRRGTYHKWATGEGLEQVSSLLDGDITAVPIARYSLYLVKKWPLVSTPSTGYSASTISSRSVFCDAATLTDARVKKSLTTEDEQREIAEIIQFRDKNNNGMSRKEAITLIMDWTGCGKMKTAENHLEYLVRNNKLPELKKGGRVVTAQATTTKRGQITVEQQLRWHGVIQSMWEEQRRLNIPAVLYLPIQAHFICNVDETSVMACEGTLKVIGDAERKKHQKNSADSRDSITIVRVGNAAGSNGPLIFLAKGKSMDVPALKNLEKLGAPKCSTIVMTPNAYMTDEAWATVAVSLCKGIREMEVSFCLLI